MINPIQWIIDKIKQCTVKDFYGCVKISIENGTIQGIKIEQSIKPPK